MPHACLIDAALDHGFQIILILLVAGFALAAPGFLRADNLFGFLHSMGPITIIAAGMALNVMLIVLPDTLRGFGSLTLGPVLVDRLIAGLLTAIHLLHRESPCGRTVAAIGNDESTAARIGPPTRRRVCLCIVISGMLTAVGGYLGAAKTGSVTTFPGRGVELVAVAVIVVGGISLFGGRGNILTGVLLGALTFVSSAAG